MQTPEMTKEDEMEMYMKIPKKKLIEMLIRANKFISFHGYSIDSSLNPKKINMPAITSTGAFSPYLDSYIISDKTNIY